MKHALILRLALVLAVMTPLAAADAARLVMFEQSACPWCQEWHRVIGPIYPKTAEARAAPLWRVDIHRPIPPELATIRPGRFTPTFVLIDDSVSPPKEIGRIRGYPGEDFFWGLLGQLLAQLPAAPLSPAKEGDSQ